MPPLCEEKAEILPNMIAGIANKNTRRTTTTFCRIYARLNIPLHSKPAKEEANVMKTRKPPPPSTLTFSDPSPQKNKQTTLQLQMKVPCNLLRRSTHWQILKPKSELSTDIYHYRKLKLWPWGRLILLAKILTPNKSALCCIASLAFRHLKRKIKKNYEKVLF